MSEIFRRITTPVTEASIVSRQLADVAASGGETTAATGAGLARATAGTVFVELGQAAQEAAIARDGVRVPPLEIDASALHNALSTAQPVVAKVVSQSIQAGVSVAQGTSVDLVLAEPHRLPIGIVANAFTPLAQATIGDVYTNFIQNNPAVRGVIARNTSADTLTDADRGILSAAFQQNETPISNNPGQTIDAAFGTLQAAFTFGGA